VLWVVWAALGLTVLNLAAGSIASMWLGPFGPNSYLDLAMALPQVSIALLAALICWNSDSRPQGLGIALGLLYAYGMMAAILSVQPLPLVVGAVTALVLYLRPREWIYSGTPPPRFAWLRGHWARWVRR
jgi:hypothetical protein